MNFPKHFRLALALGGGIATTLGERFIRFLLFGSWNMSAFLLGTPEFGDYEKPLFYWFPLTFVAGFVSVGLLAPSFMRQLSSPSARNAGWPTIGLTVGALCGFLICLALTFLNLAVFPGPWSYHGRPMDGLASMFSLYVRNGAIYYGLLAVLMGAGLGAIVETYLRLQSPQGPAIGTD